MFRQDLSLCLDVQRRSKMAMARRHQAKTRGHGQSLRCDEPFCGENSTTHSQNRVYVVSVMNTALFGKVRRRAAMTNVFFLN